MPRPPGQGCQLGFSAGSPLEGGKHDMRAAGSQEGRHTQAGPPAVSSPRQPPHAHKTGYGTYTSPRMRVQRVLTPAKESAEKGMFLGKRAGGGGRAEGGRQQTGWPAAQTITKMGRRDFQRRSGCTQH